MTGSTLRLAGTGQTGTSRRPASQTPGAGAAAHGNERGLGLPRGGSAEAAVVAPARVAVPARTRGHEAQTPSAIMVPRVLFAALTLGLVLFGLLMIYSSSSITAMLSNDTNHDPAYYFVRQAIFAGVGIVMAIGLAALDYHWLRGGVIKAAWVVTLMGLLVVFIPSVSQEAFGASRWIALGPFTLQPSEFAKITVLLVGVLIMERYYGEGSMDTPEAVKWVVIGIGIPLLLILKQPDKGTTGIIVLTLMIMMYLSGVSGRAIALALAVILVLALGYAFTIDYSRARILTMLDPERDPYGDGYQLIQGFYALGYGGLTGTGLGLSRQKYNYLPMAHNDFIFTIIGEELGFVGGLAVLVAFVALLWAGFKIAQHASDLTGRLIAAGCTSLLAVQLLLNVSGVLGIFPMSGKPVPFISYGGSSIVSCLMLAGLTLSVSLHSELPETAYERRRSQMREAQDDDEGQSDVGDPVPRATRHSLRVIEGGATRRSDDAGRPSGRVVYDRNGRRRLDLGPTPTERLRGPSR